MLLRHLRRSLDPTLLLLVAVLAVALQLAIAAGLFGLPLAIIVLSWFFKYAYVLLEDVAHGIHTPRVMSLEMVNPVEQRPLVQAVIGWAAYAFLTFVDGIARTVLGTILLLSLPASVAILGATGQVFQAVNPLALARVIGALGRYYAGILIAVVVFAAAGGLLLQTSLPPLLMIAFAMLALLATFNLIGGALYERRGELDLATVRSPEQDLDRAEHERVRERSRLLDEIYATMRAHKYSEMEARITEWLSALHGSTLRDDAEALVAAARNWEDRFALASITRLVIERLRTERLMMDALDAFQSTVAADPTFRLTRCSDALELAELASAAGRRPLARLIVKSCEASAPDAYESKRLARLAAALER